MVDFFDLIQNHLAAFLIILSRTTGIFMLSPFFGSMNIPTQIKAASAISIAAILYPVVDTPVEIPADVWNYALMLCEEILIGWLIGFVGAAALSAINMAGKVMDMQVGYAVVNVMDPTSGQQIALIGSFMYNLAILIMLVVNGHHIILSALAESFNIVPLATAQYNVELSSLIGDVTGAIFMTGMKIAMPVTFAILMVNVGMGILARTMPQMNIFVIGIPLHLFLGTGVLMMLMPFYVLFLDVIFNDMYGNISLAIKAMAGV